MNLRAQDLQAFAHEGRQSGPALGGDKVAIRAGAGGLDVDIDSARKTHFRFAILQRRNAPPFHRAVHGDQHLDAMADRENWLPGLVEVAHNILHALVDPNVFRAAPARDIDRVVFLWLDLGESLVEPVKVPGLLRIGLIALKIMQRGFDIVARLLVGTDDVDLVSYGVHRLLEHEDLVLLAELPDQHQNLLARHDAPPSATELRNHGGACQSTTREVKQALLRRPGTRPAGGEGVSERRAFFGRWSVVKSRRSTPPARACNPCRSQRL